MKSALLPMVVLLLVLPSAFAFQCSLLEISQQSFCNQIMQSNFTSQEKDALMTLLMYIDREKPNYELVSFWNQEIRASNPPQNVTITNKGTIRNAWMRIFGVMPSVIENNTFYVSNKGNLQAEYNYSYQLPSGTASGDCRTDYSFYADRTLLNTTLNGKQVGLSQVSNFDGLISKNATFESSLDIRLDTQVSHYKTTKYCCATRKSYCIKWCTKCSFSSNQIITDELILKDKLSATRYDLSPNVTINGLDRYSNNFKGKLNINNLTYLSLLIGNSSYERSSFVYDFNYSFYPYNFITLKANPIYQENTQGLFITNRSQDGLIFLSPNSKNCSLTFATHFNSYKQDCILEADKINLTLKTDKFHYLDNETINLTIIPEDILVNVTYGNGTFSGKGSIFLKARYPNNKISIIYKDYETDVFINVINQSHWFTAVNLLIFILLNYLFYKIIVRKRRVL
jgi:hypothetical protein